MKFNHEPIYPGVELMGDGDLDAALFEAAERWAGCNPGLNASLGWFFHQLV